MPRTLEIVFQSFQISNFSWGACPQTPPSKRDLAVPRACQYRRLLFSNCLPTLYVKLYWNPWDCPKMISPHPSHIENKLTCSFKRSEHYMMWYIILPCHGLQYWSNNRHLVISWRHAQTHLLELRWTQGTWQLCRTLRQFLTSWKKRSKLLTELWVCQQGHQWIRGEHTGQIHSWNEQWTNCQQSRRYNVASLTKVIQKLEFKS